MDTQQNQALKRLLKKLSAVRATLDNDERDILDQFVLGSALAEGGVTSADEVAAHAIKTSKVSGKVSDADEVAAHAIKTGKVSGKVSDADEVAAHAIKTSKVSGKVSDAAEVAAHTIIILDNETGTYRMS